MKHSLKGKTPSQSIRRFRADRKVKATLLNVNWLVKS